MVPPGKSPLFTLAAITLTTKTIGATMLLRRRFDAALLGVLMILLAVTSPAFPEERWLDGQPNAVWSRSPGFYKDGVNWYAIIHVRPTVFRARLEGDFTE